MAKTVKSFLSALTFVALAAGAASAQIQLNEIRIDHAGADTDEYFELVGPPGTALTGISLVVIGDSGSLGTCGFVEAAIDLSSYVIQPDGFLAVRYSGGVPLLTGYDVNLTGSFENSDNLTFFLVTGNTVTVGTDLDAAPEDGVLDSTPWNGVLDSVALWEGTTPNCTTDEYMYSSTIVGPDGTFVPGHIFRCATGWQIGPFITAGWPAGAMDTPGGPNTACTVGVENKTWSNVKSLYID